VFPTQARIPRLHGGFARLLPAYAVTKVMNLLFTRELAGRLEGSGVIAIAFDPGFVRTNLGRDATGFFRLFLRLVRPFQPDPATQGREAARLVMGGEAGLNGALVVNGKLSEPSRLAQDGAAAARLWTLSSSLTGWHDGTWREAARLAPDTARGPFMRI